jgi:hypothetical protein
MAAVEGTERAAARAIASGGRYQVEGLLGRGGMGSVFRAHDRQLGRTVAIKTLAASDAAAAARLAREAQLQARVDHPNVAKVYETGEAAGRALHRHAVHPRAAAQRAARIDVARTESAHRAARRGRRARGAPPRPGARRHQAAQRPGGRGRAGGMAPLRPRLRHRPRNGDGGGRRRHHRHSRLHGAGAGARRNPRPPHRRLRSRRHPLPPALGQAAVRRQGLDRNLGARAARSAAAAAPDGAAGGAGSRSDRHEVPEKAPRRATPTARALADDLVHWLDGEPVLARPQTRLYRLAIKARKNRTLVAVSAAALLGILAATGWAVRERLQTSRRAELAQRFGREESVSSGPCAPPTSCRSTTPAASATPCAPPSTVLNARSRG